MDVFIPSLQSAVIINIRSVVVNQQQGTLHDPSSVILDALQWPLACIFWHCFIQTVVSWKLYGVQ